MQVSQQIYCGQHGGVPGGLPAPYQVTSRLVTCRNGLESMHLNGWVTVEGARVELVVLGITSPDTTLHGKERAIVMGHVARICSAEPAVRKVAQALATAPMHTGDAALPTKVQSAVLT